MTLHDELMLYRMALVTVGLGINYLRGFVMHMGPRLKAALGVELAIGLAVVLSLVS